MTQKLPKGWEIRTLGEVTDIFKGGTPKRSVERYFQGDLAWATPTDITKLNGALYIDDTETHISEEALGKSAARLLPPGTVLLTSRATIGKVAISRIPIATNQGFANFLCKEEINNLFLAYYLKSRRNLLISLGTGTTFLEVTKATLLDVEIPLPPLPTQRKIAAVLSAYDDLIENNNRRINILEDMAQTLYQEWFVHFRFPGHEKVPMVESPLGAIPEGWEIKRVKEIVKRLRAGITYRGTDVNQTGKIIVIDQSRAPFLGFHDNQPDHNASSKSPIIIFGDHTCKMQLMVTPFSLGPNVVPFIAKDETPINYLFYLIFNLVETREYKRYWTELNNKVVTVADSQIKGQFSDFATSIFQQTEALQQRNRNLRQTRDLLLPKLISGEIDVFELDIDIGGIQPSAAVH